MKQKETNTVGKIATVTYVTADLIGSETQFMIAADGDPAGVLEGAKMDDIGSGAIIELTKLGGAAQPLGHVWA